MRSPSHSAVAALLREIEQADDAATDADYEWGDRNDHVAGFKFHAACARLWALRHRLAALLHPGTRTLQ